MACLIALLVCEAPAFNCWLRHDRKGSHGAGEYALPGGHLEVGESWEHCAIREVMEETGIQIQGHGVRLVFVTNSMVGDGAQYVTMFMRADMSVVRLIRILLCRQLLVLAAVSNMFMIWHTAGY